MKKIMLITLTVACAASVALAEEVRSKNAVGYIKRSNIPARGLDLVTMPFDGMTGQTIGDVMGTQLTGGASAGLGDQIMKWNPTTQTYVTYFKHTTGQWRKSGEAVSTTDTLEPGEAFFIRSNRTTPVDVTFSGEVPVNRTASVHLGSGLSLISLSYPVEVPIAELSSEKYGLTGIRSGASAGLADQIMVWDVGAQGYVTYFYHTTGQWRRSGEAAVTTDTIKPGQGVFFRRHAGSTISVWNQSKPYSWPE